jgi:hypothetical protein
LLLYVLLISPECEPQKGYKEHKEDNQGNFGIDIDPCYGLCVSFEKAEHGFRFMWL